MVWNKKLVKSQCHIDIATISIIIFSDNEYVYMQYSENQHYWDTGSIWSDKLLCSI